MDWFDEILFNLYVDIFCFIPLFVLGLGCRETKGRKILRYLGYYILQNSKGFINCYMRDLI